MNQFTIRDIENLCGIKAHTLRVWEQRYGLFVARRKESLHRTYDDNDLKTLLRISFLYHHGYRISAIAAMSAGEMEAAVNKAVIQEGQYHLYVHQLVEASLAFDKERLQSIIQSLFERIHMDEAITEVFYPFLQRIGLLWMNDHLIPAQEHFSSHLIGKKIILATDRLEPPPDDAPLFLVFSPEGEFHELPLLTANYFLRRHGCRTVYLGRNLGLDTLRQYQERHPAPYYFGHLVATHDPDKLKGYFGEMTRLPGIERIYLSGPLAETTCPNDSRFVLLKAVNDLVSLARDKNFT